MIFKVLILPIFCKDMSLLYEIFESPFKLVNSHSRDNGEPLIPSKKFEFKTDDIYDTTTKEIIFNISKRHFDDIIRQYKNYVLNGVSTTESSYALYVSIFKDDEWEYKHIYSMLLDHESDRISWENKYIDNMEIEGDFFIGIDVTVSVSPEGEDRYDEDYNYKLKKSIKEDECVICLNNKANILYTECLHFVVCDSCDKKGKLSKCPVCRKKIKNQRIKI